MGIRKSIEKVRRKLAMQATLKARRSFAGSSIAISSSIISFSSSRTVGRSLFLLVLLSFSFSSEVTLGVPAADMGGALISRVVSQSKGSGFANETHTETISPVMIAARFPAKVGYSMPVVVTLNAP